MPPVRRDLGASVRDEPGIDRAIRPLLRLNTSCHFHNDKFMVNYPFFGGNTGAMAIETSQRSLWERRSKKNASMGDLFARTNLLTRLILLVFVATLPAIAVIAYMQYKLRADGEQRIADEALRQAELLNADMANVVEGARQLSLAITHFAAVHRGGAACGAKLAELQSDLPS